MREPDRPRSIARGQLGTITKLSRREIEVHFDSGPTISMPLDDARRVVLGYASTSHSSQGASIQRVISNVDSSRSPDLVNRRATYVTKSRAVEDVQVFTDDITRMRRAASRSQEKELRLRTVEDAPRLAAENVLLLYPGLTDDIPKGIDAIIDTVGWTIEQAIGEIEVMLNYSPPPSDDPNDYTNALCAEVRHEATKALLRVLVQDLADVD